MTYRTSWEIIVSAHAPTPAASDPPQKPLPQHRKSRSKHASILDLRDDPEREVARKIRYFELGGYYQCREFKRTVIDGQRIVWALVDTLPQWRDRYRWSVAWWNIDSTRQGWTDYPTMTVAKTHF